MEFQRLGEQVRGVKRGADVFPAGFFQDGKRPRILLTYFRENPVPGTRRGRMIRPVVSTRMSSEMRLELKKQGMRKARQERVLDREREETRGWEVRLRLAEAWERRLDELTAGVVERLKLDTERRAKRVQAMARASVAAGCWGRGSGDDDQLALVEVHGALGDFLMVERSDG